MSNRRCAAGKLSNGEAGVSSAWLAKVGSEVDALEPLAFAGEAWLLDDAPPPAFGPSSFIVWLRF